jgi:hypothetical protein
MIGRPPNLSWTRQRIEAIERLNVRDKNVEQLKEQLRELITWLPTRFLEYPIDGHFWRGVAWDIRPTKSSQLSYPPADRVTRYQRANRPGEPRFYCAIGGHAPFYELGMQVGQCITLSKWRTRQKIIANHVGYTPANFARMGARRQLGSPWNNLNPKPRAKLVHDFLARQFSRIVQLGSEDEYKVSVAIAELMTAGTEDFKIHALAYPALATMGNHDNVVMFPETVETHLELEHAVHFRVTRIDPQIPKYYAEELAIADVFENGEIHWVDQPSRSVAWEPSGADAS